MGYPTTAELVADSSSAELAALTEEQQDALRAASIVEVERHCRQAFTAEGTLEAPVVKTLDGKGVDRVYMPRRLSLLSAISVDGYVFQTVDVTLDEKGETVTMVSPVGGSWLTRVRRQPGDPGPVFPRGRANVSITGVWGWRDAEWDAGLLVSVRNAIRFDMEDQAAAEAHKLASTVRSARALGLEGVEQGGLSLALRVSEPGLSMRVQRQLAGVRWRGAVGATA